MNMLRLLKNSSNQLIFEEYNVDAKIVMYEDTDYLQITFQMVFLQCINTG